MIIWSAKRTSRGTSLPFESTYLVDRYLRSVDRSSCTLVRSSPRTNVHHRVSERTIRFLRYFTVVFGIGSISIEGWTMNFSDDVTALTEIENRRVRMKKPESIESQEIGRRKKGWSRIDLYEREGNATFVTSTVSRNGPCITKRITKGKKIITRLLVQTN